MSITDHTLTILVNNQPGVLSRVAGVFSGRGYNIRTLCVAETKDPEVSLITVTSRAAADFTEKIKKQLEKLVDVIEVRDYSGTGHVHRELLLIKIKYLPAQLVELHHCLQILGGRILLRKPDSLVIEATGEREETEALLKALTPFTILEMNRTGHIAVKSSSEEEIK